uniref:Uncharacterized protein n=1 Tax=Ananas comosus var. bracteatus TaxID=296719 RepID=A0A6V7PUV3_ANACO|nr:unnamed protein product [Ananas comosus var. bracteatus]
MSLSHGNPLRRPIPHGEYESRWLSPECRLVGSDPHKHVRMSTMASSQTICRKYQVLMSNNMECIEDKPLKNLKSHQPGLGSFRPEGPVSPQQGPVSRCEPENPAFGNRSLPARDRSLTAKTRSGPVSTARDRLPRGYAALFTGGPVSHSRDRSPRVKTLRICQNSRDRTFRPVYHRRSSTKCGKVRNTNRTLEPRTLQGSSVLHSNSDNGSKEIAIDRSWSITQQECCIMFLLPLCTDIRQNIREAHVFLTTDGYSLDVFVVDGWPIEDVW